MDNFEIYILWWAFEFLRLWYFFDEVSNWNVLVADSLSLFIPIIARSMVWETVQHYIAWRAPAISKQAGGWAINLEKQQLYCACVRVCRVYVKWLWISRVFCARTHSSLIPWMPVAVRQLTAASIRDAERGTV